MKSHRDKIFIGTLIFVGIAILFGIAIHRWNISQDDSTPTPEPVTLQPQSFAKSNALPKAGAAKPKGEYTKILAEYQGRIIQFDEECHAFPNKAVFKVGTKIMFDNRGSLEREVTIGSHHTTIPPYDYMLYTLPTSADTLMVSCGPLINTATILSQ